MSHPCSTDCGGTGGQLGYGGAIGEDGCCQEPCLTAAGCNVYSIQIDVWGDNYPKNNRINLGPRHAAWVGATSAVLPHASSKFCNPAFPNEAPFFNGGDCGWHNLDLHFPSGSEAYTITLYYAAKSPGYEGKGLWYDACLREPVGCNYPKSGPQETAAGQKLNLVPGDLYRINGTSTWLKVAPSSPNRNNILPRLNLGATLSVTPGCREAGDCNCQANGPYPTAAFYYFADAAANNPSSTSSSMSSVGGSPSPSPSHSSTSHSSTSPSPSPSGSPSPTSSGSSTSPSPSGSPSPTSSGSSASPTPSPSPSGSSASPTPSPSPSGSSASPSPTPSGSSTSPSACCPAQNYWQQGETYNNGDLVRVRDNICT
jgi:hypothetical protein